MVVRSVLPRASSTKLLRGKWAQAASKIADVAAYLPANRDLRVGFYLTGAGAMGDTTPLYVREVMTTILVQPQVSGIFVYTTYFPLKLPCEGPPLYGGDRGCIVKEVFSAHAGY